MAKWKVYGDVRHSGYWEIEAESEDEAMQKVMNGEGDFMQDGNTINDPDFAEKEE